MKHIKFLTLTASVLLLIGACRQPVGQSQDTLSDSDVVYTFSVLDNTGNEVSLGQYAGKVLLVVNTATECGFTPQYEELQSLYLRYASSGFEILDFPCNQFGAQAPGSNEEIHTFCTNTYNTTFPQMSKVDVNGDSAIALYVWLKEKAPFGGFDTTDPRGAYLDRMFRMQDSLYDQNSDIKWNFTKFLIDRNGNVVRRFEPTAPMSDVAEAVRALL